MTFRKNHQRQLEALQQSLEEENKAKNDANRQKKTVEDRCYELEGNLESAQKVYIQYTKILRNFTVFLEC